MQQLVKDEIEAFLSQVPEMTVTDFQVVDTEALSTYPVEKEARPLVKLGASDFSWLDKRARDLVRPLLTSLAWPGAGLSSMAVPYVLGACQAIVCRDRLSEEQYEAYVGGFRKAGLTLPVWEPPKK